QDTRARSIGVFGLGNLTQLQRVAEQDHVLRRVGRGDGISERQLTGLVHHQHVDRKRSKLRASPQPRRARDQVVRRALGVFRRRRVAHAREWATGGFVASTQCPQLRQLALFGEYFVRGGQ